MTRLFGILLMFAGLVFGQTTINGTRIFLGGLDASGGTYTSPFMVGTSLPGTCTVGNFYYKSDNTAGQRLYECSATNTWTLVRNLEGRSFTLFDPVTGDSGRVQLYFPSAVTITRVACSVKAATSVTINFEERAAATPDTAGTEVLTSALVCDTDEATSSTFSNAGIAARVPFALTISAVSGTPDTLRVHIEYTVD